MKVFVVGAWDPKIALHFKEEIVELGRILGERGHDVIVGPGSGVVRFVTEGFREVSSRRGKIVFYLPKDSDLVRTGEELKPFADEVIRTDDDYLTRTLKMSYAADGVAAITGGAGTLYEMIGMMFLKNPVDMVDYLETANIESNIPEDGIDWYDVTPAKIK